MPPSRSRSSRGCGPVGLRRGRGWAAAGRDGQLALLRLAAEVGEGRAPPPPALAFFCSCTKTAMVWPSVTATRCTDAEIGKARVLRRRRPSKRAQDLARLGLDLLLLAAADVGDDVVGDVERGDARDSRRRRGPAA